MIATAVLVFMSVPAAHATFPGQKGKIAFTSNRDGSQQIYVMNPDGSNVVRVTDPPGISFSPEWSPDGTKIAFTSTRDGNYEIYVMNGDGTGQTRITNNSASDSGAAWSPDGARLLFSRQDTCGRCFAEIWAMHSDGADQHVLLNAGNTSFSAPDWAPDGTKIAFRLSAPSPEGDGIYTANPDGTNLVDVVPDFGPSHGTQDVHDPNWSPDSRQLAFMHDECGDECFEPGFWEIYRANRDGSQVTGPIDIGSYPEWSPDNGSLIYGQRSGCQFNPFGGDWSCQFSDIAVKNIATGTTTNLTNNTSGSGIFYGWPSWQPIPFAGYPRPKGATPMRVSLVPAYQQCASPDRQHGPPLAFGSCSSPTQESSELTVGDAPANMSGFVRYETVLGNPSTPADEADIALRVQITDVRVQNTLADYAGDVQGLATARLTDRTASAGDPATAINVDFPMSTPCTPTADPSVGSTCSLTTTLDTLIPGAIAEGQRTVLQLSQVQVTDGGADGDTATGPNTVFLRQGVFVP